MLKTPALALAAFVLITAASCKHGSAELDNDSAATADESDAPSTGPYLLAGGTVVTVDESNRIIPNGAVAVEGDHIVAVGTADELSKSYAGFHRIDTTGMVVMPGLINAHTHAPMSLFRGLADDLPLMDWLQKYIFPAEAKNVDEAFVRSGTRLALLEMIKGGTTSFADMYYFESAIADETAKAGLRGVLGETVIDFPAPDNKTWDAMITYTEAFIAQWQGHPLIVPAVAPHAPYTVSDDHLKQASALANRHQVPLLIHLAESESETKQIQEKYGTTPVSFLDRIKVLDKQVLAAHVVWPTATEIKTLAKHQVGIAHCPQSNMKLASGTAPAQAIYNAGIAYGLGTDGAASNNDLDMWEEMDTAAKLHKLVNKDPTQMRASQVLAMATRLGAKAIKLDHLVGSLETGKRADLILVRMDTPHQAPVYDVVSQLVYATKAADVDSVMVNGRLLMQKRHLLTLDEKLILAEAQSYRDNVLKSLATSP